MKKKFDINKFFEILATPKKIKKYDLGYDYPNEFGLNTKKYWYGLSSLIGALEDSGFEELITVNEGYAEERSIFSQIDELQEDFKSLDKSLNYSPIFHLRDTPEPDGLYYELEELAYLSSKKSKYSFLLWSQDYNMNGGTDVFKVYKNITKKEKKTFPKIALKQHISGSLGKDTHYCKFVFLNSAYNWGTDSEYKELMSKKKLPQSLKEHFLPIVKNKIKFSKECGNKPSDIKKINSLIAIINENRIKNKSFRPFDTWTSKSTKLTKGEVWELVK